MPPEDDGDPVRGLGFVTLYCAYLEEQIDNLLRALRPIAGTSLADQNWPVSRKLKAACDLLPTLEFEYRDGLLADLAKVKDLFERRNEVVHGRIYGGFDRPETLKSGRPNIPDRAIDSVELYGLAHDLAAAREAVYRPLIFQLPRAVTERVSAAG
jgi:hypothetical protein